MSYQSPCMHRLCIRPTIFLHKFYIMNLHWSSDQCCFNRVDRLDCISFYINACDKLIYQLCKLPVVTLRKIFRDFIPSQTIELEHVIFGLLETNCEIINFCVLHAKWFMYIQYMSDSANFSGACNVRNYCGYLKNIVKIEKECNVLGHRYDELLNVLERN